MRGIHEVVCVYIHLSKGESVVETPFLAEIMEAKDDLFLVYRDDLRKYEWIEKDQVRRITGKNDPKKDLFMTKEYWEEELKK